MRLKGHLRPLRLDRGARDVAPDQPPDPPTAQPTLVELLHNSIGLIAGKRADLRVAMLGGDQRRWCMRDVLDAIEGWRAEGHRVALATVTKVKGSAPRPPGAKMAVSDDGRWVGSVSGGCVEGAVLEEAGRVLAGEPARLVTFGITDEMVWDVGLACGGIIDVFVEPLP